MACNKCGKILNDDARFCDGCGAQINLVNNQNFNPSNTNVNTGEAFHSTTHNKSNDNMKKIIIIAVIVIVAIFFLVKVFGDKISNNNSDDIENLGNNEKSVATIDFSDAMNNPTEYQKYENQIITIEHVNVWNTDKDIMLGKVIFSLNCTNKDSLNSDGLEDGDYVTIKGQLSRVFSTGYTMNSCTMTKE